MFFEAVIKNGKKQINYCGSKYFPAVNDLEIRNPKSTKQYVSNTLSRLSTDNELSIIIQKIDQVIFNSTVDYFRSRGAGWVNLPLTTMMISSPGAVYSGQTIDYTTDTLPVTLDWFDANRIYLSESSQFYLELQLLTGQFEEVFSVYNSFRKEKIDAFHLSEFQHIEYEAVLSLKNCEKVYQGLLDSIIENIATELTNDLDKFLLGNQLDQLINFDTRSSIRQMTFGEAMNELYLDTKNECYQECTMKNFSYWEEIRLTNILEQSVIVTDFPLMQIPFYHRQNNNDDKTKTAECSDLILAGFREVIGSGRRIVDIGELLTKAKAFNLPADDYAPYINSRKHGAGNTTGFGLGWQRLAQWILKAPAIWQATIFPRGEFKPNP